MGGTAIRQLFLVCLGAIFIAGRKLSVLAGSPVGAQRNTVPAIVGSSAFVVAGGAALPSVGTLLIAISCCGTSGPRTAIGSMSLFLALLYVGEANILFHLGF